VVGGREGGGGEERGESEKVGTGKVELGGSLVGALIVIINCCVK